jgi:hypothetical protein
VKVLGKILHAVHLDAVGKAALDAHTLHVEIDGIPAESKLTEKHVFPVSPGEHEIVVWTTALRATKVLTLRSARVSLQSGQTTVLKYLYRETSADRSATSPGHYPIERIFYVRYKRRLSPWLR